VPAPFRITSVDAADPRAVALRRALDDDLDERYRHETEGEPAELTEERNRALAIHPEQIRATLLAIDEGDDDVLGHVMLRRLGDEWELKRLVVHPRARRRGVGRALVAAVVERARAAGARRVILQTGAPQPESIALYRAQGFTPIPVYEPYVATMPDTLCFELRLDGNST
jgi:ribosomal protein S18 acetylase RimI-like enzyme